MAVDACCHHMMDTYGLAGKPNLGGTFPVDFCTPVKLAPDINEVKGSLVVFRIFLAGGAKTEEN